MKWMKGALMTLVAAGLVSGFGMTPDAHAFKHKHRISGGITGGIAVYSRADFPDFPIIVDVEHGYNFTPRLELQSSLGFQFIAFPMLHASVGLNFRPGKKGPTPDGGAFAVDAGLGLLVPIAGGYDPSNTRPYAYASIGYDWRAKGGFAFGVRLRYYVPTLTSSGEGIGYGNGLLLRFTLGNAL